MSTPRTSEAVSEPACDWWPVWWSVGEPCRDLPSGDDPGSKSNQGLWRQSGRALACEKATA